MAALELDYNEYVRVNGGVEACGICGRKPPAVKLHRDHEHKGNGRPRGLLCVACNMRLGDRVTVEWMLKAIAYLRKGETDVVVS